MKVISLLNIKGGVGKTTTSNNLALGLARAGYQVLLVDLDQQANTTTMFTTKCIEKGIASVLMNPETVNEEIVKTEYKNLDLLPSNLQLAKAERNLLVSHTANYNKLKKMKDNLEKDYDYIIIDCSPVLNLLTTNALYVSDEVIIPIKVDKFALDGFKITVEEIQAISEDYELDIDIKILFTMVSRNNIQRSIIEQFNNLNNIQVYDTEIRHQAKPATQASFERTILLDQKANVSKDYEAFIEEYLER